jgi:cellulose synthase/poly-beta-1,6-N-acetylglucosamine synthase-like glycosyltransferase
VRRGERELRAQPLPDPGLPLQVGPGDLALAAWSGLASIGWCVYYLRALAGGRKLPWLERVEPRPPERWPRLSVIVPACNEGESVRPAVATLTAQDYPDLEVVLVDDRSTDSTGAIADEIASRDPRVVALHVRRLPEGWLGKVHALDSGVRAASGEWLLFTDADVHFAPGALRRAVAWAIEERLDHLTVVPELHAGSFWHDVTQAAFGTAFLQRTRAERVGRPGSRAYVGVGAFNLVRREMLARTPGFDWLRLEVLDDVGLGLMVARNGGRSRLAIGLGQVEVRWYGSLRQMARGLEKNLFAFVGHYRVGRAVAVALAVLAFALGPLVALFQPSPVVTALAAAALVTLALHAVVVAWKIGRSPLVIVVQPIGQLLLAGMLLHSAWACTRRGGVDWRGTVYGLDVLRAMQRVKF